MSLIEKAAKQFKPPSVAPGKVEDAVTPAAGEGDIIARRGEALREAARDDLSLRKEETRGASYVARDAGGRSQGFKIDFPHLRDQGFITPSQGHTQLAWDIRSVKRRLMTRMRFFNTGAEGHEVAPRIENDLQRRENVILTTSARPEEGKSFVAANLALSLAMEDRINVLLIDADVARPSVRRTFNMEPGLGLTDCLKDPSLRLSDTLLRAENLPLTILPEGGRFTSTAELFSSKAMSSLVEEVSGRYSDRIIIIDAPPILATTESIILAKYVDQVLFVVESGSTKETAIDDALEQLTEHDNVNLVLNKSSWSSASHKFDAYSDYQNHSASGSQGTV